MYLYLSKLSLVTLLFFNLKILVLKTKKFNNHFKFGFFFIQPNVGFIKFYFRNFSFSLNFKFFFLFLNKVFLINSWTLLKSYYKWIFLIFSGHYNRYKINLQLIGLGNRLIELKRTKLLLKLGYAHFLLVYKFKDMKFKTFIKKKNAFTIFSNNIFYLNNFVYLVKRLKFPDCYNANGIRFVKEKFKLKARKKWGVF